ncbi:(Fe-S)-binding protein [Nitrosospira sp. Nsp1]|uniref:(Fe-S)-binding protein n=1 Tax=Nitrosospira sp. Nsp1 TaxID=136547 RepID=UPI00088CD738|nr:heterodisulfide reductase-related iron-sulfur binding cluster [Nitrosospira sp. Nsp1]SCX39083.1 glycolate oxidase iron-sulfur subunit [Nitrosospira sp. Nsp1]
MKPTDLPSDFSLDSLIAEANRCVACGLCLPHCPTYRVTQSEADSPRGRIALMSGVAGGRIPMNERFALHIDRCLTCRACESVCPNHVRFGQLIDGTRAMMASPSKPLGGSTQTPKSWFRRWVEHEVIGKPTRIDMLRPLLRFYQRSGMQKLLRKSGLLGKTKLILLEAQLPRIDKPYSLPGGSNFSGSWQAVYPATGQPRGEVGLFLGCVARLTDIATLNATIVVLNRLGYTVHVPPAQTCCGALHQHSGDRQTAAQLAHRNISAFDGLNLEAIISTASGCGVQLAEYSILSPSPGSKESAAEWEAGNGCAGDMLPSKRFSAKVMDISAFLAIAEGWDGITLAPLAHKISVHEPCSLRNVLRGSASSYALLARIPGAQIAPLAGNDQCCGAAGTYFLDQPEVAKVLLHDKIAAVNASGARYLATSNVGCAMHVASALREAGSVIEVLHPVTLIARQMNVTSRI